MNDCSHRHHFRKHGAAILGGLLLWGAQLPAAAGDASDTEPLALREIMQALSRDMQAITGAIAQEDWARVAQLAPQVGAHPQPPVEERTRVLAYLGADAARFKGFDEQTHEAAHEMGQAAGRGDGAAVIRSFARVQESCLGCHQAFRKPFVAHFYGTP